MIIQIKDSWQVSCLEDLIELVIGGDWGKDETHNDEDFEFAYCIRGSEFRHWTQERGQTASIRKIKKRSIATRKLQYGDILLEISGGGPEQPVGRTVLIENQTLQTLSKYPIVCTNFLRLLRITDLVDKKFVNQYLDFFYKSGEIVKYQGGSNNLRNLKFDDYKKIEIPIVSLLEQKAIVAKIEQLFSELDKGIESLKTAQAKLKIYRQAVLKKAFEGELTKKKFGEIATIQRGKSKHRPRDDEKLFGGKYPFIQTGEVRAANGKIINRYSKTYSEFGLSQSKLWKAGTLCLTIAANIAETAFLGFDACFPDSVVGIKADENLDMKFVNYYIQKIKQEIDSDASATAQKNINIAYLEKLEIPYPSIQKQNQIVQEIESRLSVCDNIEKTISDALVKAEALRQSILKKAFEGKLLDVKELEAIKNHPEYESAEKLLQRIKLERAK